MKRNQVWVAIGLAAVLALGVAFTATRAGDEGKKGVSKKVVIFRSGGSWLGVQIADVDADRAKELGLREVRGAEVQSVSPGSPAEAAGVQEGDVVIEYQGTRIEGVAQLTRLVRETPPGRTASIKVARGGATKDLQVQMKPRDEEVGGDDLPGHFQVWSGDDEDGDGEMHWMHATPPPMPPGVDLEGLEDRLRVLGVPGGRPRLGITVDSVGKQLGEFFGLKQAGGVLVTSVGKGSQGESAGLKAGDVIIRVDDESVTDAGDLHMAMRERRGKALTLTIVRDRREQSIKVPEPPERESSERRPGGRQPAVDHQQIQQEVQRALRQAQAVREQALVQSQAAYRDAMRQAHEATRLSREQQEQVQRELQKALEELQRTQESRDVEEVDDTPAADDVDESDVEAPESDAVRGRDTSAEERAAIRRAVEEARRIRIETQQDGDR